MKLQSPFGASGLEQIGLEPYGLEVSKSIWLERARAKGQETWKRPDHISNPLEPARAKWTFKEWFLEVARAGRRVSAEPLGHGRVDPINIIT